MLGLDSADALYRRLVTHWEPDDIMLDAREPQGILDDDDSRHGTFPT